MWLTLARFVKRVIKYGEQPNRRKDDTASSSSSTCGHAYWFCGRRERYGSSKRECGVWRYDTSCRYPFEVYQQHQRHHLPHTRGRIRDRRAAMHLTHPWFSGTRVQLEKGDSAAPPRGVSQIGRAHG